MKKALITGISGQDGSYLAEFLSEKGYEIHGIARRLSASSSLQNTIFHQADLSDSWSLRRIVDTVQPDEIYNLGAMSNERQSYEMAEYTNNVDGLGVLRLLEAIRSCCPKARLFQASTSELFGKPPLTPQNEATPFHPRSPYGFAKLYAHWSVINYREAYNLYTCSGILFNHESPRRGDLFVTRKIAQAAAKIKKGLQDKLVLGNLDIQRDWGFAKDFVEAMWLMLQQSAPEDFVLATGKLTTVRRFVEIALEAVGISLHWKGTGVNEKGVDQKTGHVLVETAPQFYRPSEEIPLVGDPMKAKQKLGWVSKTSVKELIGLMVEHEIRMLNLTR